MATQTNSVIRDEQVKGRIEQLNMTDNTLNIYMVGEDHDFKWEEAKVNEVIELWNEGYSLKSIIKKMDRPAIETGFLIMDLEYHGKIKPRDRGIGWN